MQPKGNSGLTSCSFYGEGMSGNPVSVKMTDNRHNNDNSVYSTASVQ